MNYVFGGVLFMMGYVAVCMAVMKRVENRGSMFAILLVLFLIYSCAAGTLVLLALMFTDEGLLFYFIFVIYTIVELVVLIRSVRKARHEFQRKNVLLFGLYFVAVLLTTVMTREQRQESVLQTDLFAPIMNAVEGRTMRDLYHMILNMVLFIPVGYLFVQIHPQQFGKLMVVMGLGCMLSTLVETCQFLFRLGNCDVTDILANTIGSLLGLAVYRMMQRDDD